MDIAIRVYNELKEARKKTYDSSARPIVQDKIDYTRWMALDCETDMNDVAQSLKFGSFVVMNRGAIEQIGFFYAPEISQSEIEVLRQYCKDDPMVKLYTLVEFIKIFYRITFDEKTICTGFNLSYDLSRISTKGFGYAKGWMKGGFTLKLKDPHDKKYPDIKIRHLTTFESIIQFQGTRYGKFKGYFIDCQKIAGILTDIKRINLRQACKIFNKKYQKIDVDLEEQTCINSKVAEYNLVDTLATAELLGNLLKEYQKYEIDLPLTEIYSSASLGKKLLENLGIMPFKTQNNWPPEIYGIVSGAYIGARCECRCRKTPVVVDILDFVSQYPSLFITLGLDRYLIADHVDYVDDTKNVQELINNITLDDLRDPKTWKQLNVLVELVPTRCLLPIRALYDSENFTVGLNYLTSEKPLYYGLPSVILSKLLTGKIPQIKSALRFIPVGKQKTLKKARILGIEIDPNKDNIFKLLVEERHRCKKAGDGKEKCIKIIVNSTSYGIYMEMNKEDKKSDVIIYGRNETFSDTKHFEREGKYYNPIISVFICDAAKLLLGIGDCILQKHKETVKVCDTDSMFVPPQYSKEIIGWFDPLNPYSNVDHLLKIEEKSALVYSISSKRYVIYRMDKNGDFIINDDEGNEGYCLHGLGHLANPFGTKIKNWQKEIWLDILRLHYGKLTETDFLNKYRPFYAISQFTVSTARLMRRFKLMNKGKSYRESIKPFNFFLIGFGNKDGVKPIAPYSKDSQSMPYGEFINYKNGKKMKGQEYFKSLADELWAYINHPESKLDGDIGILQRKHIVANKVICIGKEADKIEDNMSGLSKIDQNIYNNPKEIISKILSMTLEDALKAGISRMGYYKLVKEAKKGKLLNLRDKTLRRLGF